MSTRKVSKRRARCVSHDDHLTELEHIYQTAPIGLCLLDRDLRYARINDRLAAMNGKAVSEHIGRTLSEVIPEIAPKLEPICREVIESGKPVLNLEVHGMTPARPVVEKDWLVSFHPVKSADGQVTGISTVVQDISDRKKTEERLKESEERFRAFMDNYPAAIYIKDEANRHLYGNKHLLTSFGKQFDEFIGTNSYDFFPQKIARELEEKDRFVMSSNNSTQMEYSSKMPNGEARWWRDIKFPIYLPPDRTLLGGIAIDITDRKMAEKALDERLRFEKLISNLSASFIRATASEVDGRIKDALRQLGEFLGVDRGVLAQFNEERSELRATHLWVAKGLERDEMFVDSVLNEKIPWVVNRMLEQEVIALSRFEEELPVEASKEREYGQKVGVQSLLVIPLTVSGSLVGLIGFDSLSSQVTWPEELVQRLRLVAEIFSNALTRKRVEAKLQEAFSEIRELKNRLEAENVYLREEVQIKYSHEEIVGQSDAVKTVLRQAEQVADTESMVLILGETGTGKELLARAIHNLSSRRERAMVKGTVRRCHPRS
ncbi:MAG: PAS domain-containing protein [Proteobacteria bacterium]|nr:PAS domain-containing protein [candidate division Zixibacteria bacterium]NIQ37151.1 PAS domain-containing protein [Pseudomonadota bacterium]